MNKQPHKKTVFVGLSGGVDSSVAALRLKNQGYNVVGVFIKVWQPEWLECDWEAERLDAMRVAAHLEIPFLTCDAEEEYRRHVGEYFIKQYIAGRTPNPDVMCNRHVKFGAFWNFAKARGADYIATGHYAQIKVVGGRFSLLRGKDTNKDQTYFLWTLTQEDLSHTLFPVGDTPKEEIRKEAEKAKLPTAVKKDSQGICFLGHIDIPEFISHFTKLEEGDVFNVHGDIIGKHKGALIYTLGQRHGFTVESEGGNVPHFVVSKDVVSNTIIVDKEPPVAFSDSKVIISEINSINKELSDQVEAVFRYRGESNSIEIEKNDTETVLNLKERIEKPASGQSVVFYDGEICLGGAVIE